MEISDGCVVTLHYQVRDAAGVIVDSSTEHPPITFIAGQGQIIVGLEEILRGRNVGEHVEATIPSARAYGDPDPRLEVVLPLEAFPEDVHSQVVPGARFHGPHPVHPDQTVAFVVRQVADGRILASGNHPFAGQDLHFSIDILAVRTATPADLTRARGCSCEGCGGGDAGEGDDGCHGGCGCGSDG